MANPFMITLFGNSSRIVYNTADVTSSESSLIANEKKREKKIADYLILYNHVTVYNRLGNRVQRRRDYFLAGNNSPLIGSRSPDCRPMRRLDYTLAAEYLLLTGS